MSTKAPKGGIVSPVNGQFYEGGEFTPDHGKFCGKGRNAITKARHDEIFARAQSQGWTFVYDARFDDYRFLSQPYGLVMFRSKTVATLANILDRREKRESGK